MRSPIFDQNHREQETGQRWTLQSDKMLRVALGPEVLAAQGAMVAYQGAMDFSYQGSKNLSGMLKKAVSGEGGNLMRVTGQGEVFFARAAHNVFLLQLEGDAITVNTRSLLAFDANLGYDIRLIGNAGILAGGLFNLLVQGQGVVAVSSDGPPMLLDCSQQPTLGRGLLVREPSAAGQEHLQDGLSHRPGLGGVLPAGLPRPGLRRRPAERGTAGRRRLLSPPGLEAVRRGGLGLLLTG